MREVCFCGWAGDLEDRMPVYAGDGEWGLECPKCRHLDRLHWLPEHIRQRVLDGARQQREGGQTGPRA
ncbi:MAG: hypothetical protein M3Q65_24870, partial [Chloroflexota bacterium]|nr:hypothetical protein [Chloroflexota bacterium]